MTDLIYLKKQVSIIINLYNSKRYGELIKKGMVLIKKFPNQIIFYNATALSFAALGKNKDAKSVLKDALIQANAVQDHLTNNFKTGRTGNESLRMAIADSKAAGLRPQIYTHPLGLFGHSAGTTFGMWDAQEGVPGSGDHPLYEKYRLCY